MKTAICPGSFDPVTKGHMDIINRASLLFDRVIIAIAKNNCKDSLFTFEERKELILKSGIAKNCEVLSFQGLLKDFYIEMNADALVKGIRNIRDFEYEQSMAEINRALDEKIETVFLLSRPELICVSSSNVKEICKLGGDIKPFIPEEIADEVKLRIQERENNRRN